MVGVRLAHPTRPRLPCRSPMNATPSVQVSVVVPVYRSFDCLPELTRRVGQELDAELESYELVLVDDGSPDRSWDAIRDLSDSHDFVVGVRLRKNVGQDNAVMAGLRYARGDTVVIMDDDLQHDPADIPKLCEALGNEVDVVFGRFDHRQHALWKNLGSWLADVAARVVLQKPRGIYMSPFKALRRDIVDEVVRYDGPFPYVDGLILTTTSHIAQVDVGHHRRYAGESNYSFARSVMVWLKLVTGFSVFPLRIATMIGGVISLLSLLMAGFFFVQALVLAELPPGWPSLIVAVFFLGGIQLMGIGALGEYIGRVFVTQNRQAQYSVKEVRGREATVPLSRAESEDSVAVVVR